jgi:hypothetical protein
MNDPYEDALTSRLNELHAWSGEPDWADVRWRAERLVVRSRARRFGIGAAALLAAICAATPAFGLRGQIGRLFADSKPPPAPVVKQFGGIDVAAPPGKATGVVAGAAKGVMEAPLSNGKTAVVWVAPTKTGGFCMFVSESRRDIGGGGCDRDRILRFAPGLSIPGPVSPSGKIQAPPVVFAGHTLIHGAARVEIRFEDATSVRTPVVWVSTPIDAGFFVYDLPAQHWMAGHRPVALVLQDGDGTELARDTKIAQALVRVTDGRLEQSIRPAQRRAPLGGFIRPA